jgi:hypothetical protein
MKKIAGDGEIGTPKQNAVNPKKKRGTLRLALSQAITGQNKQAERAKSRGGDQANDKRKGPKGRHEKRKTQDEPARPVADSEGVWPRLQMIWHSFSHLL